jgi:hypothetical protein
VLELRKMIAGAKHALELAEPEDETCEGDCGSDQDEDRRGKVEIVSLRSSGRYQQAESRGRKSQDRILPVDRSK